MEKQHPMIPHSVGHCVFLCVQGWTIEERVLGHLQRTCHASWCHAAIARSPGLAPAASPLSSSAPLCSFAWSHASGRTCYMALAMQTQQAGYSKVCCRTVRVCRAGHAAQVRHTTRESEAQHVTCVMMPWSCSMAILVLSLHT